MLKYPKIETLYDRDSAFRVTSTVRKQEFLNVREWTISEKIDGTNVRIGLTPEGGVTYGGRTDNAMIPRPLSEYFERTFAPEVVRGAFSANEETGLYPDVTIFGEGYGPKINNGGNYRKDVAVRIFDVVASGYWLSRWNVDDIARKLGVNTVPEIGKIQRLPVTEEDLRNLLESSIVARDESGIQHIPEGIVARPDPMMFTMGHGGAHPIMWKLKLKDFRGGGSTTKRAARATELGLEM